MGINPKFGGAQVERSLIDVMLCEIKPGEKVVEIGSGAGSTVALGQVFDLTSIEDNQAFVGKYPCSKYIHAPLENGWYSIPPIVAGLPDRYGALLVDGPWYAKTMRHPFKDHLDIFSGLRGPIFFDDVNAGAIMRIVVEVAIILEMVVEYGRGNKKWWAMLKKKAFFC